MAYEPRISVRVPEDLKARLGKAAKHTHVDESVLVRAALSSLVTYIEEHKKVTFPLTFSLDSDHPRK